MIKDKHQLMEKEFEELRKYIGKLYKVKKSFNFLFDTSVAVLS